MILFNSLTFLFRFFPVFLAIYYLTDEEKQIAETSIHKLEAQSGQTIFISVEPFRSFYSAEEEHQDYYRKHPAEFRQELIDSGRLII